MAQTDSDANTVPPQSSSEIYVYSTLKTYLELDEANCKPPAIPPKTYLKKEFETSSVTSLSKEDAPSTADDSCSVGSDSLYDMKLEAENMTAIPERGLSSDMLSTADDTCSVGSDSLYDMKLEAENMTAIPERGITSDMLSTADDTCSVGSDSLHDMKLEVENMTAIPERGLSSDMLSTADDTCSVGSDSLYDMKIEAENMTAIPERDLICEPAKVTCGKGREKQNVNFQILGVEQCQDGHLELKKNLVCDMEGNESNCQRIDNKVVNLPNKYETIDQKADSGDIDCGTESYQHSTTISHYEPLQPKTMKKPSVYEQVTSLKKRDM